MTNVPSKNKTFRSSKARNRQRKKHYHSKSSVPPMPTSRFSSLSDPNHPGLSKYNRKVLARFHSLSDPLSKNERRMKRDYRSVWDNMEHECKSALNGLPRKWKKFNKSKAKHPPKLVKCQITAGNKCTPPRNPKYEACHVQHQRDQGSVNLLVATIKSCSSKVQFLILFMSNIQVYRN